ncbi:hypothetical protein OJ252_2803 [Cryptosporidium canis]|uniref:Nuclear speckle splicing regulatory protein 1 N-terminal domain-containing protein n=1 Tax=Cryptosporidium canis TaxID=195482 RepID=A0ABQ8P6I0_9CRYT|nr:hypothetical protein OJ252_2803 [Cryptosporidium canis]
MSKGKFSFSIGRSKDRESSSLRNIFDSEGGVEGEKVMEGAGIAASDNFQSINSDLEYKRSLAFYSEHPELLGEFEESDGRKLRDTLNKQEDKVESKRVNLGKSKYLDRIKEYVDLRNIERQEIQEEKIQQEVQEDSSQVFITDAYKVVLEERRKLKDSLIRRKLSRGESSNSDGPLGIFEMRFSKMDENPDEESEAKVNHEGAERDTDKAHEISATEVTIEGRKGVTDVEVLKKKSDLKQIKIQQARERYLLRKQMREST